jgi:hypothetical protein
LTPSKTVTASPNMPGRTWDKGRMAGADTAREDGDSAQAERAAEPVPTPRHHADKTKPFRVTSHAA